MSKTTPEDIELIKRIISASNHSHKFIHEDYLIWESPDANEETRYDAFRADEMNCEFYWNSRNNTFEDFIQYFDEWRYGVGYEVATALEW